MERALATLSVGVLIVWTLAVVVFVSLDGNLLELFRPGSILFLLLPSVFPTLIVSVWLLVDKKPNVLKLAGAIGAAVAISFVGIWWLFFNTTDGIGRGLVPLIAIPVVGGAAVACSAYFIGARLPKRRDMA